MRCCKPPLVCALLETCLLWSDLWVLQRYRTRGAPFPIHKGRNNAQKTLLKKHAWYQARRHVCAKACLRNLEISGHRLHWIFGNFSGGFLSFFLRFLCKEIAPKCGKIARLPGGEKSAESCHVCGCHGTTCSYNSICLWFVHLGREHDWARFPCPNLQLQRPLWKYRHRPQREKFNEIRWILAPKQRPNLSSKRN